MNNLYWKLKLTPETLADKWIITSFEHGKLTCLNSGKTKYFIKGKHVATEILTTKKHTFTLTEIGKEYLTIYKKGA